MPTKAKATGLDQAKELDMADEATGIRAVLARMQKCDERGVLRERIQDGGYMTHGGTWASNDEEENR